MPNTFDMYLDLCTQVYELSKPKPLDEAYRFYLGYAKEAQGGILEPMCGTGRYLLPLLQQGFSIEGFDASKAMLSALKAKAKNQKLKVTVWQALLETAKLTKKYDLIMVPTGSFGLITELSAIKAALQTISDCLSAKGSFVFETETLYAVPQELGLWRGSAWRRHDGKRILLSQLATLEGSICYSQSKYELVEGNAIVQTEIEEHKIRLYDDPGFLLDLLREAGFKKIQLLKAFDRNMAPDKTDKTVIYECRK